MTDKTSFTSYEWQQLLQSVMMSSMAVSAADPSGLWGMLKEGLAGAGALSKMDSKDDENELVRAIVADYGTSEGRTIARDGLKEKFNGAKPAEIKEKSIEALRQTALLLDTKTPDQSQAVKLWLRNIGERVAEASKEGGFLGFGGVLVSEAEKATLDEISDALGLSVLNQAPPFLNRKTGVSSRNAANKTAQKKLLAKRP